MQQSLTKGWYFHAKTCQNFQKMCFSVGEGRRQKLSVQFVAEKKHDYFCEIKILIQVKLKLQTIWNDLIIKMLKIVISAPDSFSSWVHFMHFITRYVSEGFWKRDDLSLCIHVFLILFSFGQI